MSSLGTYRAPGAMLSWKIGLMDKEKFCILWVRFLPTQNSILLLIIHRSGQLVIILYCYICIECQPTSSNSQDINPDNVTSLPPGKTLSLIIRTRIMD